MSENDKNSQKDEEFLVSEANDGSATVDLPENLAFDSENDPQDDDKEPVEAAEGGSIDDEPSDADDEELRVAKRNKRKAKKDLIRKTNAEKDARLMALQRENEEFKRRLSMLERNTKAADITRIEKNIDDASVRLEYAKMKLAEATQSQDGQGMVEAQTLWQNAQEEIRNLNALKQRADHEYRNPPQQQQAPDPTIQRLATEWMQKNPWYQPNGSDRYSQVAKKIDEMMVADGYDPKNRGYWVELTKRLQSAAPELYNQDDDDSTEVRRPRNVVASSGREASAAYGGVNRNQFVLSPDRVKAMKEAGAWENPVRKKKMIEQFISFDRANKR